MDLQTTIRCTQPHCVDWLFNLQRMFPVGHCPGWILAARKKQSQTLQAQQGLLSLDLQMPLLNNCWLAAVQVEAMGDFAPIVGVAEFELNGSWTAGSQSHRYHWAWTCFWAITSQSTSGSTGVVVWMVRKSFRLAPMPCHMSRLRSHGTGIISVLALIDLFFPSQQQLLLL